MSDKPRDIRAYRKWLDEVHHVSLDRTSETYYEVATRALLDHLVRSDFWPQLNRQLPEFDDEYHLANGVYLLMNRDRPEVQVKPFRSLVDKSFRKNVLQNANFPDAPVDGWILPDNWLTAIKDVIRTYTVAKYLDGVTFLADKVADLARALGRSVEIDYEAREEGYYAAHVYVDIPAEIPLPKWDTEDIVFSLELQITTQMQEAIRKLTYPYYARRRSQPATVPAKKWQWDYQSDEFRANYLAHTLHHLEGLIMDLRVGGGTAHGRP